MTEAQFGEQYLRRVGRRYSLTEKANHHCIFWEDGCRVYDARPTQCRTYPFWKEVVRDSRSWNEEGRFCPGIDGGRFYDKTEIARLLQGDGGTGPAGERGEGGCCGNG